MYVWYYYTYFLKLLNTLWLTRDACCVSGNLLTDSTCYYTKLLSSKTNINNRRIFQYNKYADINGYIDVNYLYLWFTKKTVLFGAVRLKIDDRNSQHQMHILTFYTVMGSFRFQIMTKLLKNGKHKLKHCCHSTAFL